MAPGEPRCILRLPGRRCRTAQAGFQRYGRSSGPAPYGNRPILDRRDSSGRHGVQQPSSRHWKTTSVPRSKQQGKRSPPHRCSPATARTSPRTLRATGVSNPPAEYANARCIHFWAGRRSCRASRRGYPARSPGHQCQRAREREPQDRYGIVRSKQGIPEIPSVVVPRGIGRVQSQEQRTVGHALSLEVCPHRRYELRKAKRPAKGKTHLARTWVRHEALVRREAGNRRRCETSSPGCRSSPAGAERSPIRETPGGGKQR
jgi:hypothetical protein